MIQAQEKKESIFIRCADAFDRFLTKLKGIEPDFTIPEGDTPEEIFSKMTPEQRFGFQYNLDDIRKNEFEEPLTELQRHWFERRGYKLTYIDWDEIIVDRHDYEKLQNELEDLKGSMEQ